MVSAEKDELLDVLIFNKYQTEEKLGEGTFGKVYRGRNTLNKTQIAIKLVT
jgi:serine/threonine protein kinase